MKPNCIRCSRTLRLVSNRGHTYCWECESAAEKSVNRCSEYVDTGVPLSRSIADFQGATIANEELVVERVNRQIPTDWVPAVRTYMPQILYHYIECTLGACHAGIHSSCLIPYLESTQVLDYVLRSPVIRDVGHIHRGLSGALIYDELANRLKEVHSPIIVEHIQTNFPSLHG